MSSKQHIEEFIEALREETAIWQTKSNQYKYRTEKQKSWERLLAKCKQKDKYATIEGIKKKYQSIRAVHRRELQKIRIGQKSGNEYVPTLWYFDNLDFLRSQERQVKDETSTFEDSTLDDDDAEEEEQEEFEKELLIKRHFDQIHQKEKNITYKSPLEEEHEEEIENKPLLKKFHFDRTNSIESPGNRVQKFCRRSHRDEADIFAEAWSVTYRKLSTDQKIFAKRLMDDALMYAQLGQLSFASMIHTGAGDVNNGVEHDQFDAI